MALHQEALMAAGFLKSSDMSHHSHSYGGPHPHHGPHGPLPPGMPGMPLGPFGLPHSLDAVGFPQGMWGKYSFLLLITFFTTFRFICARVEVTRA